MKSEPQLFVRTPINYQSNRYYPLLFSIHWRHGNAISFMDYWKTPRTKTDFIMAFPQSSQMCAIDDYCWDDEALAKRELLEAYQIVIQQYPIDLNRIIIAGASQGGKLAIEMTLSGEIQSNGFISVIPAFYDIKPQIASLKQANHLNLRGFIIAGELDPFTPKAVEFYQYCQENDFTCKLTIEPGVGHAFPEKELPKKLDQAINFVLNQSK
ncbi:alpha/beta hydrolase [Tepidibacillus sp. LV47]|uniref:alpha/beta hydrolase n=1 Tax=Tepidibacillus sp. LV47 TaxID=3398228 RepID=UPI003AAAFDAE